MSDVLDRAGSLLSFSGRLEEQLAQGDPAGIAGLVSRFDELKHELGRIDTSALHAATAEIGGVIDTLGEVANEIDRLLVLRRVAISPPSRPTHAREAR